LEAIDEFFAVGAGIPLALPSVLETKTMVENLSTKELPWSHVNEPFMARCTVEATREQTSAYSLTNVLTKIVRHEERIYCRDSVVSVDKSENYNEKTAVHLSVSMTEDLEIFMSQDEDGRTLSLELPNRTRLSLEKGAAGLRLTLLDARKVKVKMDSDAKIFCEMVVPQTEDQSLTQVDKPSILSFTRIGHLHRMLPNGKVESVFPNGKTLQYDFRIAGSAASAAPVPDSVPEKSKGRSGLGLPAAVIAPSVPSPVPILELGKQKGGSQIARAKLSLYHIENKTLAVHISRTGLQKNIQKLPDGFLRLVQVSPELRITTRKVTKSYDQTSKCGKYILIEQPGLPRVGISTATKVNYISMQDGVLLVVGQQMQCFVVAKTNAVMITSDGLLFVSQLRTFGDLFGITGMYRSP
jgi:hypothetical protein